MQIVRFALLLFFAVTVNAQSLIEITDPHGSLKKLTFPNDRPEFSKAFRCGEPSPFFVRTGQCSIRCQFSLCEQQCDWAKIVDADFQIEECTNESAFLYSTQGHAIELTAADYKASGNSIVLSLARAIPAFYQPVQKIEIDFIGMPFQKKFIENGKMKTVFLTPISFIIYPDKTKPDTMSLDLNLDLSRSGLDQLMCFAEDPFCVGKDNYFIKRKGLINGP